ncbi:GIY-YIG nuclease family protein [Pokkaliibacter sp. CJK22405]|uniref:GIY-YIG nuclease family protein n=1 Tax=Pokkaliibacter sp. CJK22405 TaxID=3384615 RepID=UPI003984A8B3
MDSNLRDDTDEIWWIYIIETQCGKLYTGITNHLLRRWQQHNTGKGAKYFRGRSPRSVVYLELSENRSAASKREYAIKQLGTRAKRALVNEFSELTRL